MKEHQNIEYKQSWRDEYLKWVCGFANANGGIIYIGKDDKGKIVKLKNYKKLMKKQPELQPELQPESQPESLGVRILEVLEEKKLSKSEISIQLGQKDISGRLNVVIRGLLKDKLIELTIPNKPTSSKQKYKLTNKGRGFLKRK